jgi:tRNA A37 threonylcarbamoyladenosine modification protein TsaB
MLETQRTDFYYQYFSRDGKALSDPLAGSPEEVLSLCDGPVTVIGDALQRFIETCPRERVGAISTMGGYNLINPVIMAEIALEVEVADDVDPLYLRDADVSKSKKPQRVIAG